MSAVPVTGMQNPKQGDSVKSDSPTKSAEPAAPATTVYSFDKGDPKRVQELLEIAKEPALDNEAYLEFRRRQLQMQPKMEEVLRFCIKFTRNGTILLSVTIRGPNGVQGTILAEELVIGGEKVLGVSPDTLVMGIRVLLGTPETEFPKLFKLRGLGDAANVDNGKKTRQVDVVRVQRCDACGEVIAKDPVSTKGTVMGHTILVCPKSTECTRRATLDVCGTRFEFRVISGKVHVELASNPGCMAYLNGKTWQATPAPVTEETESDSGAESDPDDLPIVPKRKECEVAVCSWASEARKAETGEGGGAGDGGETDETESGKTDQVIDAREAEKTEVVVFNAEGDLAFFGDSKTVPMVVEDSASIASESSVASSAAAASPASPVSSVSVPASAKKQKRKPKEAKETEASAKKPKIAASEPAEPSDPACKAHDLVYTITEEQRQACHEALQNIVPYKLYLQVEGILTRHLFV